MSWRTTLNETSPRGQRVEYQQKKVEGCSSAESPARVLVSGRTVAQGWSSDGTTYAEYERIVNGEKVIR